jgi:putative oxidoreductase
MATGSAAISNAGVVRSVPKGAVVLLGRVFFSLIFVVAGLSHFSKQRVGYAASQGVPLASLVVALSGVIAVVGGLSILLGYRTKLGAWLIVLFLVGVTPLHNFWPVHVP